MNDRNNRKRCIIFLKLTIKLSERRQGRRSGVFIVNFKHVFIADFKQVIVSWEQTATFNAFLNIQ